MVAGMETAERLLIINQCWKRQKRAKLMMIKKGGRRAHRSASAVPATTIQRILIQKTQFCLVQCEIRRIDSCPLIIKYISYIFTSRILVYLVYTTNLVIEPYDRDDFFTACPTTDWEQMPEIKFYP